MSVQAYAVGYDRELRLLPGPIVSRGRSSVDVWSGHAAETDLWI